MASQKRSTFIIALLSAFCLVLTALVILMATRVVNAPESVSPEVVQQQTDRQEPDTEQVDHSKLMLDDAVLEVRALGSRTNLFVNGAFVTDVQNHGQIFPEKRWFYKTNQPNVVGVQSIPDTFASVETVLYSTEVGAYLKYEAHLFGLGFKISFSDDVTYKVSPDLTNAGCGEWSEEEMCPEDSTSCIEAFDTWIASCNQQNPLVIDALMVNDDIALTVEPLEVQRESGLFDGQLSFPGVYIELLGASSALDGYYFSYNNNTYFINSLGEVVEANAPESLVTVTDALY